MMTRVPRAAWAPPPVLITLARRLAVTRDALLELVFLGGVLAVGIIVGMGDFHPGDSLLTVVFVALILGSLRFPRACTLAVSAGMALCLVLPTDWLGSGLGPFTGFILIQSLVRRERRALAALFLVRYVTTLVGAVARTTGRAEVWLTGLFFYSVLAGLAWAGGQWMVSVTKAYASQRTLALVEQRRTIARELHDGVAQQLSRVVMRTEQAKLHGGASEEDLAFIHDACSESIRDLRSMLELLRSADTRPERITADAPETLAVLLDRSVADLRRHGFTVALTMTGDVDALPSSALRTLGGVVREVTSNIIKHGRPDQSCTIMVELTEDAVEAAFLNVPRLATHEPEGQRLGLVGISERLRAQGGLLETQRGASQWVTRIVLPLHPHGAPVEASHA